MYSQFAFFVPFYTRFGLLLHRCLILGFAERDRHKAIVGVVFAFRDEIDGLLNCETNLNWI